MRALAILLVSVGTVLAAYAYFGMETSSAHGPQPISSFNLAQDRLLLFAAGLVAIIVGTLIATRRPNTAQSEAVSGRGVRLAALSVISVLLVAGVAVTIMPIKSAPSQSIENAEALVTSDLNVASASVDPMQGLDPQPGNGR